MKKTNGLTKLFACLAISSVALVFSGCGKKKVTTQKPVDDDEKYDAALKMKYKVFNGEAEITQIDKQGTKLVIPESIGGATVTRVSCTYTDSELTEVEIPATLTYLTGNGFMNCENLTTVKFTGTSTLADIPSKAFLGTKISSITIPASVRSISFEAFQDIDTLTTVTFASGSNLETIGPFAFYGCDGLTSITLPNKLTSIGASAFEKCENLSTLTNSGATKLEIIDEYAFSGCYKLTSLDFTSNTVLKTIGANAFRGCSGLTSVTFDEALNEIGSKAFYNTQNITSLVLPKNLTKVGDEAFVNAGLEKMEIKSGSDTTFGTNAFSQYELVGTKLVPLEKIAEIKLDGNLSLDKVFTDYTKQVRLSLEKLEVTGNSIASNAYKGCVKLNDLTIANTVLAIGESAFEDCTSISDISLVNENLSEISKNTFKNCTNLENVVLSDKVVIIRDGAFDGCVKFDSIDLSKVTLIGDYAFRNTLIATPTFSRNLQTIGESAFENCVNITEVLVDTKIVDGVPGGVASTTIRQYAFMNCKTITKIDLSSNVVMENNAFLYDTNVEDIAICGEYGLDTLFGESKEATAKMITTITIKDGTKTIENGAFNGCLLVNEIIIPNTVKRIGDEAFRGCRAITTLNLPNTLEKVGRYAFADCDKLVLTSLPSGITEISEGLFLNDFSIGEFTLNDSTSIIGNNAFKGCSNLVIASLNDGITYIGDSAFDGCLKLELSQLPEELEELGSLAFNGCLLVSVNKTNDNLVRIGSYALRGCQAIASFEFVNDLGADDALGEGVLEDCTNIKELKIYGTTSLEYLFGKSVSSLKPILSKVTINEGTTSLADNMFKGFEAISVVTMPTNSIITRIGSSAFEGCISLSSIDISKVEYIGKNAFAYSGLESIEIPANGIKLGDGVFANCTSLSALTFADASDDSLGITVIPAESFNNTILVSVELPDSVKTIAENAFGNILTLNSFKINTTSALVEIRDCAFTGCSNILDFYIPSGVNFIGVKAFAECTALREVNFGSGNSIGSISESSFQDCYALTVINLPSTIRTIGVSAFDNCTCLVDLVLPSSLDTLGINAFSGCESLNDLVIPEKIEELPSGVFANCYMLETVYWNNNIKVIGSTAFFNTPFKNGYVADESEPSGYKNVRIPNTINSIGPSAFASENDKPVTFEGIDLELGNDENGVSLAIDTEAFSKSGVNKVTFGSKVVSFGVGIFLESSITEVDFTNLKITKIENSMFNTCKLLTKVTFGTNNTINTIGDTAFKDCEVLNDDTLHTFATVLSTKILSIGASAFEGAVALQIELNLGTSTNITIGDRAFFGSGIKKLVLGAKVIKLGNEAFSESKIKDANLSALDITAISDSFFANCIELETVTINNKIRTIGKSAFTGTAITNIDFLAVATELERIMESAFENCEKLGVVAGEAVTVVIPDSVSYVGAAAFKGCTALSKVKWSEGANVINDNMFDECKNLKNVSIPENVSRIGKYAFTPDGTATITFNSIIPPSVDLEFAVGYDNITFIVPTNSLVNYNKNYVFVHVIPEGHVVEA